MKILKTYIKEVNELILANKEAIDYELKPYQLRATDLLMQDITPDKDKTYENIQNYYRYYIIVIGLKCLKDKLESLKDFDCSKGVITQLSRDYPDLTFLNHRYFKENNFKIGLETDTAYSFKRIFHDFLRKNYSDFFIFYQKFYHLKKVDEVYKAAYLLKNIAKIEIKKEHQDLMSKFNKLAYLYHTYNNVILVPYGYNCLRNDLFLDLYTLSMQNLLNLGFDKRIIKKYCGYVENEEMVQFTKAIKGKLHPNNKINKMTIAEYNTYLDEAIFFIEKRVRD